MTCSLSYVPLDFPAFERIANDQFRGDLNGRAGEPALASDIASAGKEWSATHWRKEDMVAYVFRLYLEWARLVAPSRSKMDFVYRPEMEVGAEGVHTGTEHGHDV